jgi:hypothetical protein
VVSARMTIRLCRAACARRTSGSAMQSRCGNKQGTGRRGLSLLCFYFGCSLRRPVIMPSLGHDFAAAEPVIEAVQQPERRRTIFRAVNPPSSRASRVGAGVEPRHHARVVRSRPAGISRRADIAGGPALSRPHAKLQAKSFAPLQVAAGRVGVCGSARGRG